MRSRFAVLLTAAAVALVCAAPAQAVPYVHLDKCKAALTGANGDDDMGNWVRVNRQTGWDWSYGGYHRYSNTRLGVTSHGWGSPWIPSVYPYGLEGMSYCMGDDSDIVDKAFEAPSGF